MEIVMEVSKPQKALHWVPEKLGKDCEGNWVHLPGVSGTLFLEVYKTKFCIPATHFRQEWFYHKKGRD
jgi:hypothetical protein